MKKRKTPLAAPLPFQGQKRMWINYFKEVLINNFNDKYTFVDLFGGSGLLSHLVKTTFPNAKVIYNDFDNYCERLQNIDKTNVLLKDIREILKDSPNEKKLTDEVKNVVVKRLEKEKQSGFVDWLTVSSWLLFSMNYATTFEEITKHAFYNCIRLSDYSANDYLKGVEIVKDDYRTLFNRYKHKKNVVFIVDPPYLTTEVKAYKEGVYWKLAEYLDVLNVLKDTNYIYFTSEKSSIIELINWLQQNLNATNPFDGSIKKEINATTSSRSQYKDIMFCKRMKHH